MRFDETELVHIIDVTHSAPQADVEALADKHVEYLNTYHAEGRFLLSGQKVNTSHGGVIIVVRTSAEEVSRISAEDPFVQAGLSRHSIYSFDARRGPAALRSLL